MSRWGSRNGVPQRRAAGTRRGSRRIALLVAWLGAIAVLGGCASETTMEPVEAWQGMEPHLLIVGSLDGEDISVDLSGAAAQDATELFCTREYLVPESMGVPQFAEGALFEIKVNAFVTVGGERRRLELELKQHDFQSASTPATITVVPRSETMDPGPTEAWVEWEWHDLTDVKTFESAAQAGTITLELFSGTPDMDGLVIPEGMGMIGGHVTARWSETEQVTLSFTAPCTENGVEIVAP